MKPAAPAETLSSAADCSASLARPAAVAAERGAESGEREAGSGVIGTVCLYRGTSLVSKIIRRWSRGKYSHASFLDLQGREYEAWLSGVQCEVRLGENHTPGTQIDLFEIALTAEQYDRLIHFLQVNLYREYDWSGLFKFLTRRVQKNPDHSFFCSEYIAAAFVFAGKPLQERVESYKVFPDLLSYSPLLKPAGSVTVAHKLTRQEVTPASGSIGDFCHA